MVKRKTVNNPMVRALVDKRKQVGREFDDLSEDIRRLQRECEHEDTDAELWSNGYEMRKFYEYTCRDCGKIWSSANPPRKDVKK